MNPNYSHSILMARVAIRDVLHVYCISLDDRRWDNFDKVFHDEGVCHLSVNGGALPWRVWVDRARGLLDGVERTHHQIGQSLIVVEGKTALSETYVSAYHTVPANARPAHFLGGTGTRYDLIVGTRYVDEFALRERRWGITARRAVAEWRFNRPLEERT
jgi:SnoaL-like domain